MNGSLVALSTSVGMPTSRSHGFDDPTRRQLAARAQEAGVVRKDVEFPEVMQMLIGIGKIPTNDPGQIEHILRIALDGLRYRPQS